jgi:hypothetical protein
MRFLLPHLRLLTLGPGADDYLQSFLTAEEQLHVLHFNIYGTLRTNTPATLNTNMAKRTKLTEHSVTLIPDEAVSRDIEYLFGNDVYNWSKNKCSLMQNSVSLRSKSDIFLTSFELVGSFASKLDCSTLKFEEISDSFEIQPKICLASEDFWETKVKFGKQFSYKDVDIVRSVQTKFGYQKVLKCAQLIPKGVAVDLFISLTNNEVDSKRCCQVIKDSYVNEALRSKKSLSEIDSMVVKSYIDDSKINTPFFVKSLGYIKKCEI